MLFLCKNHAKASVQSAGAAQRSRNKTHVAATRERCGVPLESVG
jgi:hypothetical protein